MRQIYYIFICGLFAITLILSGLIFVYNYNGIFQRSDLCSSFIDNVEYYSDQELCRLPCNVENKYEIRVKPDKEDCPYFKPLILIKNDTIFAFIDTEVAQYVRNGNEHEVNVKSLRKGESVKLLSEVVRTNSSFSNKTFDWFIKFIPKPVEKIISENKLSVNLLLIDAASRYVAKKQLQKTVKTLQSLSSQYSIFDMLRYHTIDLNSDPHYPTLFYGVNQTEGKDIHKVIFDDYKEEGYKTINTVLFVDFEEKLTAHNNYNGSDHYINYMCEDPKYNNVDIDGQYGYHARCVGHKQIHKYVFKYLKESIKYYHDRKQPTFALTVFLDAHDYMLYSLPRIDKDLSGYIKFLHRKNILNDSVLILFSDHGIHYGPYKETYFGTLDRALPLMIIIFPKWFTKKYPDINRNLKINQNRFVTGFDFHATLFDIAHFSSNRKNYQNKRGISLFNEIPKNRNCRQFNVTYGCSCNMTQEYLNIPQYN